MYTYTLIAPRLAKFPRQEWSFAPVVAKVHLELRRCTEATSVGHADVRRLVADPLHACQVPGEAPRLRAVMPINRHGAPVVDEVRGNVVIGKIFSVPRQRRAFRHEASGDARVRPVFQRAADQLALPLEIIQTGMGDLQSAMASQVLRWQDAQASPSATGAAHAAH